MNCHIDRVQRIIDAQGLQLSLAGMVIVFTALALICAFIALLPRVLPLLNRILPESAHHHAVKPKPRAPAPTDDGAVIAAIAVTMHHHRGGDAR